MATARYKPVRALHRGLDVLAALNRHNGATVQTLAAATGVHRTTVYRLLETLQTLGYVKKGATDDTYRLALAVRRLSDGFDDDAWVSLAAGPAMRELHARILWPCNVATYDYDAMLVRESTERWSPFAIHHALVGQRLPVLRTALGQTYLAFCGADEREEIVAILRNTDGPDQPYARDAPWVRDMVARVRRLGYAAKPGEREKRIAALAVPILRGEQAVGSVNMVFFRSAHTIPAAVERYLSSLRTAAAAIAEHPMDDARPVTRDAAVRPAPPESALATGRPRVPRS